MSTLCFTFCDLNNNCVATEFNARGDLFAGGSMVGFLRVANAMLAHGAV